MASKPVSNTLTFGTFEVEVRAGELRKQGKRIKLQDQPFQVLAVLLQRPGDVVTREELRSQIWPQDTFVDFDDSLNTAISKIREALGDSADSPRFIETLPRRGYRFLAPVSGNTPSEPLSRPWDRKIVLVATLTVLLAAVIIGGSFWRARGARILTEKDTIVLGDFTNSTGDPIFDGTLREGLSVQLQQSPFLSLLSEDGIQQTLGMMGQPSKAQLTPPITREVCQRNNSAAALNGSITLIGNRYSLILKAVNCANGDILASTDAQANDKSHVLDALARVASNMRGRLGESLATIQKFNTPLEQATTSSLEALQAFTLAGKADFASSVPFLQRAIQLDPDFAMAYDQLAESYAGVGETALGEENTRKAFELRGRTTELEKLIIEAHYYRDVTGNRMDARKSDKLGKDLYPREPSFPAGLGLEYNTLGEYELGLKEHQIALRLLPNEPVAYRMVAYTDVLLDRIEDAAAMTREAHGKGLESSLPAIDYGIAFLRNDPTEMARQVALTTGKTGEEDLLLALDADAAAYFGHLARAREQLRQAANSARREKENEAASVYEAVGALREGLFGNTARAERQARTAMEHSGGRDEDYAIALAFLYAGNGNSAQRLADSLNKKFPEGTIVQFNYLPTLRAKLALMHSNPQLAIHDLESALLYELGLPANGFYNWPNMYPVYVRGEAYLAAHQGKEAAAEFQKILDHRGIVLNEPIGALAHLQLGRAYVLSGDTAKARAAYQDFLTLWKDADSDIPIFKQAKAEFAKLQ